MAAEMEEDEYHDFEKDYEPNNIEEEPQWLVNRGRHSLRRWKRAAERRNGVMEDEATAHEQYRASAMSKALHTWQERALSAQAQAQEALALGDTRAERKQRRKACEVRVRAAMRAWQAEARALRRLAEGQSTPFVSIFINSTLGG